MSSTATAPLVIKRSHRLRTIVLIFLLGVLVFALFALLRPLALLRAAGEFTLWRAGIHSEYTMVGHYQIHYYAGGEGPPVVFVHGLTADALNWVKAMINLKRAGYRVYALDLLGHGKSAKPDIDYSIEQQSEMLRQFLLTQNIQSTDLVSVSMGGWIVLNLAIEHPEVVRRLVVADAAGLNFETTINSTTFLPRNQAEMLAFWDLLSPRPYALPRPMTRDYLRQVPEQDWIVQRIFTSMEGRRDLLDGRLDKIHEPVLLLWGKQEKLIPLWVGERMHQQIPQSSFLVCPESGHLAIFECWERYKPEVLRFLSSPQPIPPETSDLTPAGN